MSSELFRVACASTVIAAAVACATAADEEGLAPPSDLSDGGASPSDAAVMNDAPPMPDVDAAGPTCSEAGWCLTPLPDSDLIFADIWPLPNHAFAVASTGTAGRQLLEWSEDVSRWSYVDDDKQGTEVPANVWSPNENEVYYAFFDLELLLTQGLFRGYVNHGRRPLPPETIWSWTRHPFDCDGFEQPWVWGASADDVYVMVSRTIHRLKSGDGNAGADGGTSPWIPEYVDDDPMNPLTFRGATGTGGDDVWFVGDRGWGACAVVIRKTSTGYRTIVDGVPEPGGCGAKDGLPTLAGTLTGWSAPASDRLVAILGGRKDVVKIAPSNDGSYAVEVSGSLPASLPVNFDRAWGASEEDLWFLAKRDDFALGPAIVRGTSIWNDGGLFEYSTLVLNGAPNTETLSAIRGTSNNNIWAVGANRAYHKTSP